MKMKLEELEHWFKDTYNIIGDFVLGVDHTAVRES